MAFNKALKRDKIPALKSVAYRYFRLKMFPKLKKREVIFFSISVIPPRIAASVVLSAVFDDSLIGGITPAMKLKQAA